MPILLKIRVRNCGDGKARLWLLARHTGKPTTEESLAYGELSQGLADQVLKIAKDGHLIDTEAGPDILPEEAVDSMEKKQ